MQGKCIGVYATNDDLEAIALVPKDELLIHKEQDHESNAKLIASAPKLLEALMELHAVVMKSKDRFIFDNGANAMKVANAFDAIKEATE